MDTRVLEGLRADVVVLLERVADSVEHATTALIDTDLVAVERVIAREHEFEVLNRRAEGRIHALLADHPDAAEVSQLVAALRTLQELELSGGLVVNIAKGARRLYPRPLRPEVRGLVERMGRQAVDQLRTATEAYANVDRSLAAAVADMDDEMDDLTKDLLRAVFRSGAGDEAGLQHAVQVALVGRYYERIGDHARIVAQRVVAPWGAPLAPNA